MSKRIVKSPSNEGLDLLLDSSGNKLTLTRSGVFNQLDNGAIKVTDTTPRPTNPLNGRPTLTLITL